MGFGDLPVGAAGAEASGSNLEQTMGSLFGLGLGGLLLVGLLLFVLFNVFNGAAT